MQIDGTPQLQAATSFMRRVTIATENTERDPLINVTGSSASSKALPGALLERRLFPEE